MKDYSYESYPTESSADGTLLYISNHLSYKTRTVLCIYKSRVFTNVIYLQIYIYWKFKSKENKYDCGLHLSSSSCGLKGIHCLIHQ